MNGSYLKVVHAVRQRHHEPGVVVDGLVAENDIYAVVEIPEIVLGCRQLTAVILWVIPEHMKERWMKDELRWIPASAVFSDSSTGWLLRETNAT